MPWFYCVHVSIMCLGRLPHWPEKGCLWRHGSISLKCGTSCQEYAVLQDRWSDWSLNWQRSVKTGFTVLYVLHCQTIATYKQSLIPVMLTKYHMHTMLVTHAHVCIISMISEIKSVFTFKQPVTKDVIACNFWLELSYMSCYWLYHCQDN